MQTRIDKLLDTWKDTKDPDPEWSGPAYDYFKSQKEDLEKDLEVLEILKNKNDGICGLIYAIRNEEELKDKYKYESSLDFYNKRCVSTKLTQEEFDKLAEWVKRNDIIYLPLFEKNTMYKGMRLDKEYSLKELGLDE